MYHRIRITVASLVIVIACMLSSASTLSYFTDSDMATNSFTIGNLSTTLMIYDDVSEPRREFDETNYEALMPGRDYDIPFYLQAMNDGNVRVYQRFRIVIPSTLDNLIELDLPEDMGDCDVKAGECSNDSYAITYDDGVAIVGENNEISMHAEYYITSKAVLGVGEVTSEWPITGIKISIPEEGDFEELFVCADNGRNNCAMGISVYSDSIQITGFVNAETAFANVGKTY